MTESARSLLVYQLRQPATAELVDRLQKMLAPLAQKLNAEVVVADSTGDVTLQPATGNLGDLINALNEQAEATRLQTNAFIGLCEAMTHLVDVLIAEQQDDDDHDRPQYLEQRVDG